MVKKVVIMLTSNEKLGETGRKTGWFLPEAAHPYKVLTEKGFEVEFASTAGGKAPVDEISLTMAPFSEDPVNLAFWKDSKIQEKLNNTKKAADLNPKDYSAVLYAGGHGVMWDFPNDAGSIKLGEGIWKNGGVVSAVCHGPVGLLNLKDEKGEHILKGRRVAGSSNEEETTIGLDKVVPFSVEDSLKSKGGVYSNAGLWGAHVQVDGKLVTGQNPASATGVAEEIAKLLA